MIYIDLSYTLNTKMDFFLFVSRYAMIRRKFLTAYYRGIKFKKKQFLLFASLL